MRNAIKIFTAITMIAGLAANLLSIMKAFDYKAVEIGTFSIRIPSIEIGPVGSVHLTFAILFYLIVGSFVFMYYTEASLLSVLAHVFIPKIGLLFWSRAFFPNELWPMFVSLYFYVIIEGFLSAVIANHVEEEEWAIFYDFGFMYYNNVNHKLIFGMIVMFPILALSLLYAAGLSASWAWLNAAFLTIIPFTLFWIRCA